MSKEAAIGARELAEQTAKETKSRCFSSGYARCVGFTDGRPALATCAAQRMAAKRLEARAEKEEKA